jgi:hypothetical protein
MNKIINIDPVSKYFIWTPEKTASHLCYEVFKNSDFHTYGNHNGFINKIEKKYTHNNFCDLFKNHEDYKFILTIRNPYSLMVSYYKSWGCSCHVRENFKPQFEDFVQDFLYFNPSDSWVGLLKNINKRIPDHTISVESLYSDYSKLPIIKNNEFYQSNTLELKVSEIIGRPENYEDVRFLPLDWREFYSVGIADIVYYYFANYFEMFGYDRNSWKL